MNATLIANGINRRFSDVGIFYGVLRTLVSTGRAVPVDQYVVEKKDGEVDGAKIAGKF